MVLHAPTGFVWMAHHENVDIYARAWKILLHCTIVHSVQCTNTGCMSNVSIKINNEQKVSDNCVDL